MIVECGECLSQVSDKASACPKCGAPPSAFRPRQVAGDYALAASAPPEVAAAGAVAAAPVAAKPKVKWVKYGLMGLGAFVVLGIIGIVTEPAVQVTNLRGGSQTLFGPQIVTGNLVNPGSARELWVWVEQNGQQVCPRKTYIMANATVPFSFRCDQLKEGLFNLMTNTYPSDWIKTQATSL